MTILAAVFGLFMVALGLVAMTSPQLMLRFANQFTTQAGVAPHEACGPTA